MTQHYYLCTFQVYKEWNSKTKPHTRRHYIRAGNAYNAYQKAQALCKSGYFSSVTPGAKAVCRHKDVQPAYAEDARKDIEAHRMTLIEEYGIKATHPGGERTILSTFLGDGRHALVELRSKAFDLASSGKYGTYPDDIESFNEQVEAEFSEGGLSWKSENGTILKIITL